MDVGELIRATRLELGLEQGQLARRAGTSQTYVSRVERGDVSPSMKTAQRLMYAMGMRLAATAEPLSPGNLPAAQLREDFRQTSASERVREAMELSEFLTGVADSAQRRV